MSNGGNGRPFDINSIRVEDAQSALERIVLELWQDLLRNLYVCISNIKVNRIELRAVSCELFKSLYLFWVDVDEMIFGEFISDIERIQGEPGISRSRSSLETN